MADVMCLAIQTKVGEGIFEDYLVEFEFPLRLLLTVNDCTD